MADNKIIDLSVNTTGLIIGVKAATTVLGGLEKVINAIGTAVEDAFAVKGYEDYKDTVRRFGKDLADELLVLQLNFGRMKAAIADAVSPIAAVFVPMLNSAIYAVIRFAGTLRQFLTAFFVGITGNQALAGSAQEAAAAEEELASAAGSAGKAARRSLVAFDEINRLNAGSGGSGGTVLESITGPGVLEISPQVQAVVDRVLALLEPLRNIDLTPLRQSLQTVQGAFSSMANVVAAALEWLWYEVLTPFAAWVVEELAPALMENWAAKLEMVAAATEPVLAGMQALWAGVKPIVEYIGTLVLEALDSWRESFERLSTTFREKGPQITAIFQNVAQVVTAVWSAIAPVLEVMRESFSDTFRSMGQVVDTIAGTIIDALNGVSTYLSGVFTGNWGQAWTGIKTLLKGVINGIIGLLNSLISRLVSALNSVIRAANRLSFTVPDWVPGLGGSTFGVSMGYVSAPQIPYLAKGAVLPAGRPFLAVVGDQRHGTNIEAPLSTIQEAVALVMEEQTSAILAGFEASVGVQREILEAVLGISIGDDVIGAAALRYNRKQAVMRGGAVL